MKRLVKIGLALFWVGMVLEGSGQPDAASPAPPAIGGVVLNSQGRPVARARLVLLDQQAIGSGLDRPRVPAEAHVERTDSNGRWSCTHWTGRLEELAIQVEHADYATGWFSVRPMTEPGSRLLTSESLLERRGTMLLQSGFSVSGTVLNPDGQPVEGARITGGDYPVWTPVDGRFALRNCRPGPLSLLIHARGHAPELRRVQLAEGMEPLGIELGPGATLEVQVRDTQEDPVPNALVEVVSWRNRAWPEWSWRTDSQGVVRWDSAPSDPVAYRVQHPDYRPRENLSWPANGETQIVTLTKPLRISGRVLDAASLEPIPEFRVVPGRFHVDHHHWDWPEAMTATNGFYAITLSGAGLPHAIRIEADGYYPAHSRAYQEHEEEQTARFSLVRGEPIQGWVRFRDGLPGAGVEVALVTREKRPVLGAGRFIDHDRNHIVETDGSGAFVFQPHKEVRKIVAAHPAGYAEIVPEQLESSPVIQLQPWGRIEGRMRLGSRPATNQLAALSALGAHPASLSRNHYTSLTRADGGFAFENVPPGRHLLGRVWQSEISHGRLVRVEPGQTVQVEHGGTGLLVRGRILVTGERELDWDSWYHPAFFKRRLAAVERREIEPGAEHEPAGDFGEGLERQVAAIPFRFEMKADGGFEAEDIPPGEYDLEIHYHQPPVRPGEKDRCLGRIKQRVVIPSLEENGGAPVFDLGIVRAGLESGED